MIKCYIPPLLQMEQLWQHVLSVFEINTFILIVWKI